MFLNNINNGRKMTELVVLIIFLCVCLSAKLFNKSQYDSSSKKFELSKKEVTSKIQEELIYVARRNTKSCFGKKGL